MCQGPKEDEGSRPASAKQNMRKGGTAGMTQALSDELCRRVKTPTPSTPLFGDTRSYLPFQQPRSILFPDFFFSPTAFFFVILGGANLLYGMILPIQMEAEVSCRDWDSPCLCCVAVIPLEGFRPPSNGGKQQDQKLVLCFLLLTLGIKFCLTDQGDPKTTLAHEPSCVCRMYGVFIYHECFFLVVTRTEKHALRLRRLSLSLSLCGVNGGGKGGKS